MAYPDTYDAAVVALSPSVYYPMDDPAGGTISGGSPFVREATGAGTGTDLWFPNTPGLGTLGATSIVPGTASTCLQKTGANSYGITWGSLSPAERLLAIPTGHLTFIVWFQASSVMGGGGDGQSHFYGQFFAFNIGLNFESLQYSGITAPTNAWFVPNATYMLALTFDGTNGRTILNGADQGTLASSAASVNANTLELGGVFNSLALLGFMQKLAVFPSNLSLAQIQNLYLIGAASFAETAGKNLNVYPFSRQAIGANPARVSISLTNVSDTMMFISLGDTTHPASASQGIPIAANGEHPWYSSIWKGPIQVIHAAPIGTKTLLIEEH